MISIVKNILENIVEQPEIFPTANNSIQMEYELIDNSYLEFEIFEDKIICLEVPNDIKIINNIVNNFFERSDIDES